MSEDAQDRLRHIESVALKTSLGLAIAGVLFYLNWAATVDAGKFLLGPTVVTPNQIIKLAASGVPLRNYLELNLASDNALINTEQSWSSPIPNTQAMGVDGFLLAVRDGELLIPIKAMERERPKSFAGYFEVLPDDAKDGLRAYERNIGKQIKFIPYLLDATRAPDTAQLFKLLAPKFVALLIVGWVILTLSSKAERE